MEQSTNGASAPTITANPDAERQALAEMIQDSTRVNDAYEAGLTQSDFVVSGHAKLFDVLVYLAIDQDIQFATTFIIDELMGRHGLSYQEANALALLGISSDHMPGPTIFWQNIELIKRASAVRRLQAGVSEVFQRIHNGFDDYAQLGDIAVETIRQYLPAAEPGDDAEEDQPFAVNLGDEPTAALGWVAQYADAAAEMTSSPRQFNLLIALSLASAAIGGKARLRLYETIRPNLYCALVGASSVHHKSTSLILGRDTLRSAGLERLLLPESGTSEGLVAALADQPAGLIIRDEIGRLFGSDKVRHLATYKADLTDLYGGQTLRKRLSGVDIRVENPYVCIMGATTPARFFDAIGAADWDDGFLVRWCFALPDCAPRFDPFFFYAEEAEIDRKISALAAPLRRVAAQQETSFILEDNVLQVWGAWLENRHRRAFEFGDETMAAVTKRFGTTAWKFAMILAAVNGEWGRISIERMNGAIWLADLFRRNFWELLNGRSEHGVSGAKLAKVLQVVNRHGAAGCTTRQIQRGAHLKSHQLRPVLDKLLQLGAVIPSDDGKRLRAVHDRLPIKNYL